MTNTPHAYERLIADETDIVFVAGPSDAQGKTAATAGKTFKLTPIGKEAFVFFVNRQNSVNKLTTEQAVQIYSGRLKNWRETSGEDKPIRAFQRNENSGSQTAMQKIMGNPPLMTPPYEDRIQDMGGIVNGIITIITIMRWFFPSIITPRPCCKTIRLDCCTSTGLPPHAENIANGSYPYTREFYPVTTGNESPAVRRFIEWIQSAQGKELLNKTGYVAK